MLLMTGLSFWEDGGLPQRFHSILDELVENSELLLGASLVSNFVVSIFVFKPFKIEAHVQLLTAINILQLWHVAGHFGCQPLP